MVYDVLDSCPMFHKLCLLIRYKCMMDCRTFCQHYHALSLNTLYHHLLRTGCQTCVYLPVSSTYKIQISELHKVNILVLMMRINIY